MAPKVVPTPLLPSVSPTVATSRMGGRGMTGLSGMPIAPGGTAMETSAAGGAGAGVGATGATTGVG